jgi:hypothetical protein
LRAKHSPLSIPTALNRGQQAIRNELYRHILDIWDQSLDSEYPEEPDLRLMDLTHRLLVALMEEELSLNHPMGCTTNCALALMSLDANGTFKRPSVITGFCAGWQYDWRCTIIHKLRLKASNLSGYVPFSAPGSKSNTFPGGGDFPVDLTDPDDDEEEEVNMEEDDVDAEGTKSGDRPPKKLRLIMQVYLIVFMLRLAHNSLEGKMSMNSESGSCHQRPQRVIC